VSRHNLGELRIDFNKFSVRLCIAVFFIEKDLSNNNFSKSTIDCSLKNVNSNNLPTLSFSIWCFYWYF
jgi:hypothetical protein